MKINKNLKALYQLAMEGKSSRAQFDEKSRSHNYHSTFLVNSENEAEFLKLQAHYKGWKKVFRKGRGHRADYCARVNGGRRTYSNLHLPADAPECTHYDVYISEMTHDDHTWNALKKIADAMTQKGLLEITASQLRTLQYSR